MMYSEPKENSLPTDQAMAKQRRPAPPAAQSFRDNRPLAITQRKMCGVIQRATPIQTSYGTFDVTKYEISDDGKGADIELFFLPDSEVVDATKIGMIQSVCAKDSSGEPYAGDPRARDRMVETGPERGYQIDRLGASNSPVYGAAVANAMNLEETPLTNASATYKLGKSVKAGVTPDPRPESAKLVDNPRNHSDIEFETTALALDGVQKNTYYGSVKWGFSYRRRLSNCFKKVVILKDINLVSMGDPSSNFKEAARLWNLGRSACDLRLNKKITIGSVLIEAGASFVISGGIGAERTNVILTMNGVDTVFSVRNKRLDFTTNTISSLATGICRMDIPVDTGGIKCVSCCEVGGKPGIKAKLRSGDPVMILIKGNDLDTEPNGYSNVPLPV